MKPSFTNQTRPPATDAKFHPTDEHLIAENKEEVVKTHHGDKLETEHGHDHKHSHDHEHSHDQHANQDGEEGERATAP